MKKTMSILSNYYNIFTKYDFTEGGTIEVDTDSLNWYDEKMKEIVDKYINSKINLSSHFHKEIYNEELTNNITPEVFQHLKMMYCYGGGFNNNDYHKLPVLFRSKVHNFVKNESQINTVENCISVSDNLRKKYNFPEKFADAISWMWLYEPARKIIIEDANV
tara:strand:+ start:7422 stop:7907 length:486 start_codon:yes stop_codon:yes gene_type:complete